MSTPANPEGLGVEGLGGTGSSDGHRDRWETGMSTVGAAWSLMRRLFSRRSIVRRAGSLCAEAGSGLGIRRDRDAHGQVS